jgi:hypothetical protein
MAFFFCGLWRLRTGDRVGKFTFRKGNLPAGRWVLKPNGVRTSPLLFTL